MSWLGLKDVESIGDSDQRPYNWRAGILREYPNGDMPLTGLTALMNNKELTDDPQFYWWEKEFQDRSATVTGQYTDSTLAAGVAYATGGVAGDVLYFKMASADVAHFRERHKVLLRDASDYLVDVHGVVVDRQDNGASSYIAVKLLEADDNSSTHNLVDCDKVIVHGNMNPEFSEFPEGIKYHPTKIYNLTGIYIEPVGISRTALRTKYRTGDAYAEDKREALEYHGVDIEMDLIWSMRYDGTGENGHLERAPMGLVQFIKTYSSDTVDDFSLNSDAAYKGETWENAGADWLMERLEIQFRHGSDEKLMVAGSGVLLGLQKLVQKWGQMTLTPTTTEFGWKVTQWVTPFGVIYIKTHPLLRNDATTRNMGIILEPKHITYRYIDDTFYCNDPNYMKSKAVNMKGGNAFKDGIQEGFITECGYEFHFAKRHGILYGFNTNNLVV